MKVDRKALCGGLVLVAAVPLLMLWQSSDHSKGTGPGRSKYITLLFVREVNEHLCNRKPEALGLLCDFTLDLDGNVVYTETWVDYIAAHCGECADVHLARGRIARSRGDEAGMRREFAAARAAVRDDSERERCETTISRFDK